MGSEMSLVHLPPPFSGLGGFSGKFVVDVFLHYVSLVWGVLSPSHSYPFQSVLSVPTYIRVNK